MGKLKKKKPSKYKQKETAILENQPKSAPTPDIDSLLKQAEESIDEFNYENAQLICHQILHLQPDNARALELNASIAVETGNFQEAKECLARAITVSPDNGHTKYMTIAQMHDGHEALRYYEKGIEVLNKQLEINSTLTPNKASAVTVSDEKKIFLRDLSMAYCAVAELYMTDCCFDNNAETLCQENLEKSIVVDESNIEAFQTFASFYLIKEEKQKALESIHKSLSLWFPHHQAVREGRIEPYDRIEVCPLSYQARVSTVKILIELEDYNNAGLVLEGLVEENDEVVETWYLLGWMNYLQGDNFKSNSRFYFKKCRDVATKIHSDEEDILNHVEELLTSLGPDEDDSDEDKENEPDGVTTIPGTACYQSIVENGQSSSSSDNETEEMEQ